MTDETYATLCALDSDPIQAGIREALCVPTKRCLWTPDDEIEFTPPLSNTIYGDGKALLGVSTIYDRPAFWIVRIDGGWVTESDFPRGDGMDVREAIEEITECLYDEFGNGEPLEDDEDPAIREYGFPFPAINLQDGFHWFRIDWPEGVA